MKQSNLAISIGLITGSILGSPVVWANPQGAQVVQGSASFSSPSTNVLTINNSRNAIINWQSFNIGAGQTTNFIQPSSTSSVLNRVITNNPSQILGNLNSNGRVFLINQHGILVGEGASINTAGFFGSTLNITDSDFLNGNLKFDGGGQGDFENQGYIHAGEDGSIILIAPNIQNGGVIEVDNGNIILAAGKSITITSLENSSIQFEVTSAENQITNLGQIVAKNGSASLFAGTLQHSGSIRATGVVQNADGSISLITQGDLTISDNAIVSADGDSGGNINIQSELGTTLVAGDVTATGSAGTGGNIQLLGEYVGVSGDAKIDASGVMGGGQILVGGDYQGSNPDVQNATATYVGENTQIHADAIESGNGGKVIIWSDDTTRSYGEITAKGGAISGDGGLIETSGGYLELGDKVPDASAANGENGTWLIDPEDITVISGTSVNELQTGSGDPGPVIFTPAAAGAPVLIDPLLIEAALNNGSDVELDTTGGGLGTGNITISSPITKTDDLGNADGSTLTLNAHNNININADITSTFGVLNLTLNPDQDKFDAITGGIVNFDTGFSTGLTIDTSGGSLTVNGNTAIGGESVFNLNNTDWVIQADTDLIISGFGPLSFNIDSASSLINDGLVTLEDTVIQGLGRFENNEEITIGGFSSAISTIDTTTLTYVHNGLIEILDLVTLNLTIDGSQGVLDLQPAAGLVGGGTLNGDVTVNGGYLAGGDGFSAFGALTINGKLEFNSGLFYSVIDATDGLLSSFVSASTATISGGDLMAVWGDSFAPLGAFDGISGQLLSCTGGAGCLGGAGFTNVINPIIVTQGTADMGVTFADTVTYELTAVDAAANIITWISSIPGDWNVAGNWSSGVVPTATDYVFIENGNGTAIVDVTGSATFNGLQSNGILTIKTGGNLALAGDAFILDDINLTSFGLIISGAGAAVSGTGVLYVAGPTLLLDDGILQADVVNWGVTATSALNSFQIDSNFINNALMGSLDNTGTNTITGTGSLVNNGIFLAGANFDTSIQFDNNSRGVIDISLSGVDFSLSGNSNLAGSIDVITGSSLSLSGGTHTFADGMSFIGDLNINSGVIAIEGGLTVGTLNLNGGVVDVNTLGAVASGNTLNANILSWNSGAIISGDTSGSVTGILDIGLFDLLNLVGSLDHSLVGITVNNAGTINYATAGDFLFLNDGTVINNNSQFLIQGDQGISSVTGTATIFNNGTIVKTAGVGTSLISVTTNHSNTTIDSGLGSIAFGNGGQLEGAINVLGTGFTLSGGTHTFVDGVSFIGDLNITGGIVAIEGGLSIGTLNLSGGVVDIDTLGVISTGDTLNANIFNWDSAANITGGVSSILNIGSLDTLTLTGTLDHVLTGISVIHDGVIDVNAVSNRLILANAQMTSNGAATITGLGTLELQALSDWTINTVAPLLMPVAMTLDLNGGSLTNAENLIFPGTVNVNQANLVLNGPMVIPDTTTFNYFASDNILPQFGITNNGTFIIQNGLTDMNLSTQDGSAFVNNGIFQINSTTTLNLLTAFQNNGLFSLSAGAAAITQAGATLFQAGTIGGSGVLSVNGGVLDFTAATLLPNTLSLNLVSGSLINAQNLTTAGQFNWTNGTIAGTGAGFMTTGLTDVQNGVLDTIWSANGTTTISGIVSGSGEIIIPVAASLTGSSEISVNTTLNGGTLTADNLLLSTNFNWLSGTVNGLGLTTSAIATVQTGVLDTLWIASGSTDISSDVSGTGTISIPVNAVLTSTANVISTDVSLEGGTLTSNNLQLSSTFDWLDGTVNGTGLSTSGLVNLTKGGLGTDWTITPSGIVNWVGTDLDNLVISNVSITNQGIFNIKTNSLKGFSLSTNAGFVNQGTLVIDAGTAAVVFDPAFISFNNDGGTIRILSGIFSLGGSALILDQVNDNLQGFGTFEGDVINAAGTVTPGKSDALNNIEQTGTLTINGDYTQGPAGTLDIKLDSTILQGLQHDVLHVAGLLTADGTIKFRIVNNKSILEIAALLNQSFAPLQFNSFAGKFAEAIIPAGLNFTLEGGGIITISSDIQLLNDVANVLEVLLSGDNLDFTEMVAVMRFIDQKAKLFLDEDEDEEDLAPRLVCK